MNTIQKKLTWDDFSNVESDAVERAFLPTEGEGDNFASQAVTAIVKLIYKWFNDGDVYDNRYGLSGWANDLSSYANWLYEYVPDVSDILMRIKKIGDDKNAYAHILYDTMEGIMNWDFVNAHKDEPCKDTIYECRGPFAFKEYYEDDEEDDW